jgi:Putative auto-transporter adhesin, head GIN domain
MKRMGIWGGIYLCIKTKFFKAMKNVYFLLLGALSLGLLSCEDEFGIEEIEVTYDTVPFDRIRLETSSNIRIIQSNIFQVVVRGQKRDVNDTEVRVSNDRLVIEERGHIDEDQLIKIYVPEISELSSIGSSLVYGESEFEQNRSMDLELIGSGEIDMYVATDNLDILLSGSGYMYLEGLVDNVDLDISGSGWVRSFNLDSDFSDVRIEGSGSAEVSVDTDLDAVITGSGNIYYKGHPNISSTITGSGKLIDAN